LIERRRTERVQKRARCQIRSSRINHDGVVLGLSEGGLALVCDAELDVAETVRVELSDPRAPIVVSAISQRRARRP
jgi:hypothetical protein